MPRVIEVHPDQEPKVVEWDSIGFQDIQAFVGGIFCTAFRIPSPGHRFGGIDGWCNDDGLYLQLPLNFWRWDGSPIVGPVVVMGSDDEGASRGLTDQEVEAFVRRLRLGITPHGIQRCLFADPASVLT